MNKFYLLYRWQKNFRRSVAKGGAKENFNFLFLLQQTGILHPVRKPLRPIFKRYKL